MPLQACLLAANSIFQGLASEGRLDGAKASAYAWMQASICSMAMRGSSPRCCAGASQSLHSFTRTSGRCTIRCGLLAHKGAKRKCSSLPCFTGIHGSCCDCAADVYKVHTDPQPVTHAAERHVTLLGGRVGEISSRHPPIENQDTLKTSKRMDESTPAFRLDLETTSNQLRSCAALAS